MLEWVDKTINLNSTEWQFGVLRAPIITKNSNSSGILNEANATTFCSLIQNAHKNLLDTVQITNYKDSNPQNVYSFYVVSGTPNNSLYYVFTQGSHCSFLLELYPQPNIHIKKIKIKFNEQEIFYATYNTEKQSFEIPITFSGNFNVHTFECNILQESENTLEQYYNKTYYGFSKPTDIDLTRTSFYRFEDKNNIDEQNLTLEQLQYFLPIYQYQMDKIGLVNWKISYNNLKLILKPTSTINDFYSIRLFSYATLFLIQEKDNNLQIIQDINGQTDEEIIIVGYILDENFKSFEGKGYPFKDLSLIEKEPITENIQLQDVSFQYYPAGLIAPNTPYAATFTLPGFLINNKSINLTKYHLTNGHTINNQLDNLNYKFKFNRKSYNLDTLTNAFWDNFGSSSEYIILSSNLNTRVTQDINCYLEYNKAENTLILNNDVQHPISLELFELYITARTAQLDTTSSTLQLVPLTYYTAGSAVNNWNFFDDLSSHAGSRWVSVPRLDKEIVITHNKNTDAHFINKILTYQINFENLTSTYLIINNKAIQIENNIHLWNSTFPSEIFSANTEEDRLWWFTPVNQNITLSTPIIYEDGQAISDAGEGYTLFYNINLPNLQINFRYFQSRIIQENFNQDFNLNNTTDDIMKNLFVDTTYLYQDLPHYYKIFTSNMMPGLITTIPFTEYNKTNQQLPLVSITTDKTLYPDDTIAGFVVYLKRKKSTE